MYEWDEAKRQINLVTHKIDLASAILFEWDSAIIERDVRKDYGEERFIAFGPIEGRLHVMVFTFRNLSIRVISLRKANVRERKHYEQNL